MPSNNDTKAKEGWLDEHLPYELKMARYCFKQMQAGGFYLDWNAYHSAFAVAACNLAAFLTNQEKQNLRAHDFVQGFRSRKGSLAPTFYKLEPQVFHLGKDRPTDEGKFNLSEAAVILDWIETEMKDFVGRLGPWQKYWNEKRSIPEPRPPGPVFSFEVAPQAASSADPVFVTFPTQKR